MPAWLSAACRAPPSIMRQAPCGCTSPGGGGGGWAGAQDWYGFLAGCYMLVKCSIKLAGPQRSLCRCLWRAADCLTYMTP